jgi:RNA recognition motif-containing protein
MRKIYVGNLPFTTTEPQLIQIFEQIGQVQSARIVTDAGSGRSKGFGFVEMANELDAAKAIEQFNGAELEGRPLTVSEAKGGTEPRRRL